jgi:hypothetical protein
MIGGRPLGLALLSGLSSKEEKNIKQQSTMAERFMANSF